MDYHWFSSEIVRKMGYGAQTSFWKDCWVGLTPLCENFPRLFSICLQSDATVSSLWSPNSNGNWNLVWRRRLFVWETVLLEDLMLVRRSSHSVA
jgi:hypothetical protein